VNQIAAIQILRAFAALMVVFSHAQGDALNEAIKAGSTFSRFSILPLDTGVDLFFVISGFIMVHASLGLFAKPGAGSQFISRRLIRIVPLYWLMTAIMLVILGYIAWSKKHAFPSFMEIGTSLAFFPFARPEDGEPRPVVSLGWTLNYEMFFYVVFAFFVRFERHVAVAAVALALALAVGMGTIFRPTATAFAYWSDAIVLEFALGMLIALLWQCGLGFHRALVVPLVIAGLAVLMLDFDGLTKAAPGAVEANGFDRLLGCGLPMALIFGAIVLAKPQFSPQGSLPSFFMFLGDASYGLYLFHPLIIIFARKAYLAGGLQAALGYWPLIAVEIPMAIGLAFFIHARVEKPISAVLQKWLREKSGGIFTASWLGLIRSSGH
jgi:peptidoglycan/LPS O-acetylase OafA/YrhL